jgi:hypothetical protein
MLRPYKAVASARPSAYLARYLCPTNTRVRFAVPRTNSGRAVTLRAAAGRITRNVSRKSNQWNAVAAARANNVARVRVVILSKAIMEASLSYVREMASQRPFAILLNIGVLWVSQR